MLMRFRNGRSWSSVRRGMPHDLLEHGNGALVSLNPAMPARYLKQTLARVNRTIRGTADWLLVAYATLVDNLAEAVADGTVRHQASKSSGGHFAGILAHRRIG